MARSPSIRIRLYPTDPYKVVGSSAADRIGPDDLTHARTDRVERSGARSVFLCIPVESPVLLKGTVSNWLPSGDSDGSGQAADAT